MRPCRSSAAQSTYLGPYRPGSVAANLRVRIQRQFFILRPKSIFSHRRQTVIFLAIDIILLDLCETLYSDDVCIDLCLELPLVPRRVLDGDCVEGLLGVGRQHCRKACLESLRDVAGHQHRRCIYLWQDPVTHSRLRCPSLLRSVPALPLSCYR